ncbi:TonB-dependent receptor [Opitutales bacterium]|nr:TonB-dependent receptor [Opitutales bacterium]
MYIFGIPKFCFSFILSVVISGLVHAEEQVLEPMEVSALRLETPDKNLPARIQVIDQARIELSGATNIVGLLRKEANLQVRSTSGNSARASISLGGFGDNGGHRTLVLLDGHRLNAFDLSPINWHSIPLAMIKSIEVIRGAQSGTYGNHTVGGVIKINTKLPKLEPTASLEAFSGSFDSFNARGAYSQKLGEIGLTIFGERAESDGYRMNGDHQTDAGGLRLDWGNESDFRGYLSWSLSNSEFGLPGSLDANTVAVDRRQTSNPDDRGEARSSQLRAGLMHQINEKWRLENRIGYEDRKNAADMPSQSGYLADTDYETFSYSPILHHNSEDSDYLIGFDYFKGELDLNGIYTSFNSDASRDYERMTAAIFTSVRHSISEEWDWIGNLRFQKSENNLSYTGTKLEDVKDEDWASGIGLIRKFGDVDRLYTTIRRFFRYPSTDELIAFYPPSYFPANHLSLVPENGYEAELGLDWSMEKILLSGRIFRQWMEQEIIVDGFDNINLDETSRIGLDLSLSWELADYASTGISYDFVRAKIEKGTYEGSNIPLVAESLVRLFLEIKPIDSLLFNIGGSYVGESFVGNDLSNSNGKLEDYWLYDILINYELSESATFFGGVDNLLDEEYLSTAYNTALYPGEGRNVRAGLRFSF